MTGDAGRKFWDSRAKARAEREDRGDFAPMSELYEGTCARYVEDVLPGPGGRMLEAGCGTGRWIFRLAGRGLRTTLLDYSPEMIRIAGERVEKRGLADMVDGLHVEDLCDMRPLADQEFDLVLTLGEPLGLCSDPGQAVDEMFRVLKPGGHAVCDGANKFRQALDLAEGYNWADMARTLDTGESRTSGGLRRTGFSSEEFRELFEARGFQVRTLAAVCPLLSFPPDPAAVESLQDEAVFALVRDAFTRYAEDPAMIGVSARFLVVAQKPAPQQAVEKRTSAALPRKVQILAYEKYASILNFSCALHLHIFEQPVFLIFLTFRQPSTLSEKAGKWARTFFGQPPPAMSREAGTKKFPDYQLQSAIFISNKNCYLYGNQGEKMPRNPVQFQKGLSEFDFRDRYGTEEQCREALFNWRWPDGFVCPRCGGQKYSVITSRNFYQCSTCRKQTSLISGTIFQSTKISLVVWFAAMYHLTQTKQGISSLELARRLGISQNTAWKVKHKLMQVMLECDSKKKIGGRIEIDDAYIGGESTGKRGRGSTGKTPFIAAVQTTDEGNPDQIKLSVVDGFKKKEVEKWCVSLVLPKSVVVSDGLSCFLGVKDAKCIHERHFTGSGKKAVKHSSFKWVNTALGNIKSSITGSYRSIEGKHTPRYLAEFQYRFNRRYDLGGMIPRLAKVALITPPMPYRLLKLAEIRW